MRITVLALMLAVSHVALVSHVTAHFDPKFEQCELCVGQAKFNHAISSSEQVVPVGTKQRYFHVGLTNVFLPVQQNLNYLQRAPPSISP